MSPELKAVTTVQESRALSFQSLPELKAVAEFLAGSDLLPTTLRKKPADVAIILLKGQELGLQPMQALDSIEVIQGKATLKPEAQLALIYQKVKDPLIQIEVDSAKQTVRVLMGRSKDDPGFSTTWDMARARQMGLDKKENYIKQPLTMLKWRAVGEAARTIFPDVTRGMYNTFEAEDFNEKAGEDKGSRLSAALADEPREVVSTVEPSPQAQRAKADLEKTTTILAVKPKEPVVETAPITEQESSQLVNGDFDSFFGGPLAKDDDSDPVIKIGKLYLGKRMSQVPAPELAGAYDGIKKLRAVQSLTLEQADFIKDYEFYVHNRADKGL